MSGGLVEAAMPVAVVRVPQWLRSTAMPSAFIFATAWRPNSLIPASPGSRQPSPIRLRVL